MTRQLSSTSSPPHRRGDEIASRPVLLGATGGGGGGKGGEGETRELGRRVGGRLGFGDIGGTSMGAGGGGGGAGGGGQGGRKLFGEHAGDEDMLFAISDTGP